MDEGLLTRTRRGLHAVAEYLVAGPQYARTEDIRLRVGVDGFAAWTSPESGVEAGELLVGGARHRITGTCRALAAAAQIEPRDLRDVYASGPELGLDDTVELDAESVSTILGAFARGDAAMRSFAPDSESVLWPEHFDVGITVEEVNLGVSPGEQYSAVPYAYVGPWSLRVGTFWNAPFGAARPMSAFDSTAALTEFFADGVQRAATDRPESDG